jgi:hypothetical protein
LDEARSQKMENIMKAFLLPNLEHADNPRLTGTGLATKVRKMSTAQRAALAARLIRSEVSIAGLIPTQAAALVKVGVGNVRLAANASEADIAALKRGVMSLRQLRDKRRRAPSQYAIEEFLAHAGVERVMSVACAMTAPPIPAAAE